LLAKNHVAGYESLMALILVDVIAKQILRELGVDKVGLPLATSKIFFIHLSLMHDAVSHYKVIFSVVLVIPSPVYALSPLSLHYQLQGRVISQ
jgi:hypothetical protein